MKFLALVISLWSGTVLAVDVANCTYEMAIESSECRDQLETETLAKYSDVFKKDDDGYSLIINLKHGTPVKLMGKKPVGVESESSVVIYRVFGVLEPLHYAVVFEGFYEGSTIYLIDMNSGSKYHIDGVPLLSPDHARIAVSSFDIDANYNKNFLDVYREVEGKLVKEVHIDGEADPNEMWGPDHVVWTGNGLITFDRVTHAEAGDQPYAYAPRRLVLNNGKWVLEIPQF